VEQHREIWPEGDGWLVVEWTDGWPMVWERADGTRLHRLDIRTVRTIGPDGQPVDKVVATGEQRPDPDWSPPPVVGGGPDAWTNATPDGSWARLRLGSDGGTDVWAATTTDGPWTHIGKVSDEGGPRFEVVRGAAGPDVRAVPGDAGRIEADRVTFGTVNSNRVWHAGAERVWQDPGTPEPDGPEDRLGEHPGAGTPVRHWVEKALRFPITNEQAEWLERIYAGTGFRIGSPGSPRPDLGTCRVCDAPLRARDVDWLVDAEGVGDGTAVTVRPERFRVCPAHRRQGIRGLVRAARNREELAAALRRWARFERRQLRRRAEAGRYSDDGPGNRFWAVVEEALDVGARGAWRVEAWRFRRQEARLDGARVPGVLVDEARRLPDELRPSWIRSWDPTRRPGWWRPDGAWVRADGPTWGQWPPRVTAEKRDELRRLAGWRDDEPGAPGR
jgi:hypothetical protein